MKLSGQAALKKHKKICGTHKTILRAMPQGDTIEFEEWVKTQRHPIFMHAEFGVILRKCLESKGTNSLAFQKHESISYELCILKYCMT